MNNLEINLEELSKSIQRVLYGTAAVIISIAILNFSKFKKKPATESKNNVITPIKFNQNENKADSIISEFNKLGPTAKDSAFSKLARQYKKKFSNR